MREVILAALKRDPELLPKVTGSLREKIAESGDGPVHTVIQAAASIEPVIAEAVRRRPSRLGKLGLKSATLLAGLAMEDAQANRRLAALARNSTVGIVFVDVAGFTSLTAAQGDEVALDKLGRLQWLVEDQVGRSKGELVKRLGDGFLIAFPSASQAVRGSLAIRDAVLRERSVDDWFDLRLRIAVHAGEPLIEDDDLLGHDVNLTARLLEHCEPDRVIVSEAARESAVRRLTSVSFGRRRAVKIRGLAGRVVVYEARQAQRSRSS